MKNRDENFTPLQKGNARRERDSQRNDNRSAQNQPVDRLACETRDVYETIYLGGNSSPFPETF